MYGLVIVYFGLFKLICYFCSEEFGNVFCAKNKYPGGDLSTSKFSIRVTTLALVPQATP